VKPGSGAKLASPVNAPIVQVPSPATTSVRPASVAEAEVSTTLGCSRAPTVPAPLSPAESLPSGSKVTGTPCAVVLASSVAVGGTPTVTTSCAVPVWPSSSETR